MAILKAKQTHKKRLTAHSLLCFSGEFLFWLLKAFGMLGSIFPSDRSTLQNFRSCRGNSPSKRSWAWRCSTSAAPEFCSEVCWTTRRERGAAREAAVLVLVLGRKVAPGVLGGRFFCLVFVCFFCWLLIAC